MGRSFSGPWIQTSMTTIDLENPRPEDIHIEDIAHSLSLICRFGGHTKEFYSVAQHSVLVSELLDDPELRFIGLLHDASEAYIGDVVSPLKHTLTKYLETEDKFHLVIGEKFGLGDKLLHMPPEIKVADLRALKTEVRDVMGGELAPWNCGYEEYTEDARRIRPLSSEMSRKLFLSTFRELSGVLST